MAYSTVPGILAFTGLELATPARTRGCLGLNDQGDPRVCTRLGDTPGCTGVRDGADMSLPWWSPAAPPTLGPVRAADGTALALPVVAPPLPPPGRPPWMKIAEDEARRFKGETEDVIQRSRNYHLIVHTGRSSMVGKNNAWCAAFVNTCLQEAGVRIENPMFADNFVARGRASGFFELRGEFKKGDRAIPTTRNPRFVALDVPVFGAIAVETKPGGHGEHVGFVYSRPKPDTVVILGGNQSDRIKFDEYDVSTSDRQRDHLVFFFPSDFMASMATTIALGAETAEQLNARFEISLKRLKVTGATQ